MKKRLKRIWLPVVTMLIIGAGVLVLTGALRVGQAYESNQTVIKNAEANSVPEQTDQVSAVQSDELNETLNTVAEAAASSASGAQIPTLPEGCTVTSVLNEAGDTPGADELSYDQAGAIAVDAFTKVFGDAFTSGSTDIYVQYRSNEGMFDNSFEFYAAGDQYSEASFTGWMDAVSGRNLHIENHTPAANDKSKVSKESLEDRMLSLYEDEKIPEVARKLINEKFADGRTIDMIIVDGIQGSFSIPGVEMLADCTVGLGKGDCYLVQVGYPTYDIRMFEIHPVG